MSTNAIELLRAQFAMAEGWFGGTMEGVTDEVAQYSPPGECVIPIAGQVAHTLTGIDFFIINTVAGRQPLLLTEFADRDVISEPPPMSGEWKEWADRVTVDGPGIREYSKALFATVDEILADMEDADLSREVDFGESGTHTAGWAFSVMLLDLYSHTGEIACIKGLQGLKGYPM